MVAPGSDRAGRSSTSPNGVRRLGLVMTRPQNGLAASGPPLLVSLTRLKVHWFRERRFLAPSGLKSARFGTIPGLVAARSWRTLLDAAPGCSHNGKHERPERNLRHLPEDYSLAQRWLRPSFLKFETEKDARPARPRTVSDGTQVLRHADPRNARVRP